MIASKTEAPKDDKVRRRGPLYPHGNTTMATVTSEVLHPASYVRVATTLSVATSSERRCYNNDELDKRRVYRSCLSPGHYVQRCQNMWRRGCQRRHIHYSTSHLNQYAPLRMEHAPQIRWQKVALGTVTSVSATSSVASSGSSCRVGLQVVPVQVSAPNGGHVIETYAFLDSGSNVTMC